MGVGASRPTTHPVVAGDAMGFIVSGPAATPKSLAGIFDRDSGPGSPADLGSGQRSPCRAPRRAAFRRARAIVRGRTTIHWGEERKRKRLRRGIFQRFFQ